MTTGVHVWGFISDDLLVAGYTEARPPRPTSGVDLIQEATRTVCRLREQDPPSALGRGLLVSFAAKKKSGSWERIRYHSGDWEAVVLWITGFGNTHGPGRHVAKWWSDESSTRY